MLTVAALGLVVLLLESPAWAGGGRRRGAGPIEGPEPIDIGEFRANVGNMPYWDLSTLSLGPELEKSDVGGVGPGPTEQPVGQPATIRPLNRNEDFPIPYLSFRESSPSIFYGGGGSGGAEIIPKIPELEIPVPIIIPKIIIPIPVPDPWIPDKYDRIDPPLSEVNSYNEVVARTMMAGDEAIAINSGNIYGTNVCDIEFHIPRALNSTLRDSLTFRETITVSNAHADNATIIQDLINSATRQTSVRGATTEGTYLISAVDTLELCIESAETATVKVYDQTTGLDHSTFVGGKDTDYVQMEAVIAARLMGVGESKKANISIDIGSVGMDKSEIQTYRTDGDVIDEKDYKYLKYSIASFSVDGGITYLPPSTVLPGTSELEPTAIPGLGSFLMAENGYYIFKPDKSWNQEPFNILYTLKGQSTTEAKTLTVGESGADKLSILSTISGTNNTKIGVIDDTLKTILVNRGVDDFTYGIDLQFEEANQLEEANLKVSARAIGAQDSTIMLGNGNDVVYITAIVTEYLQADMGAIETALAKGSKDISVRTISLLNSTLDTGSGDDSVTLRGDVINSIIKLGTGNNALYINGSFDSSSKVIIGEGDASVTLTGDYLNEQLKQKGGSVIERINGEENTLVFKSSYTKQNGELIRDNLNDKDNEWEIINTEQYEYVNGAKGNDTLVSSGDYNRDSLVITGQFKAESTKTATGAAVVDTHAGIYAPNQGNVWGMQFLSFENADLGTDNDVVLMKDLGGLSGKLMMGEGIDTLDYTNWGQSAIVDLRDGRASGIGTGASSAGTWDNPGKYTNLGAKGTLEGVEIVIGSGQDDLVILGWEPWLDPYCSNETSISGGKGADEFSLTGIGNNLGNAWNKESSVAVFKDINLDEGDSFLGFKTNSENSFVGGVRQIASIEVLRAGVTQTTEAQLAIAIDKSGNGQHQLVGLGMDGAGQSRLLALLPGANLGINGDSLAS